MKIIRPVPITDANLLYTSVPETDAPVWNSGTPYSTGDVVMLGHTVYQAAANNSNKDPSDPDNRVTWPVRGATNAWRMFDMTRGTEIRTTYSGDIVVEVATSAAYSAMAVFGLSATTVIFEVVNGSAGVVYSKTINVISNTGVNSFFEWYWGYSQRLRKQNVVDVALPYYPGATLRVTLSNAGGGDTEVGKLIFGRVKDLGCTAYGIDLRYLDFSPRKRDTFGNLVSRPETERRKISQRTFPVTVDSDMIEAVETTLKGLGGAPTVFIGSENHNASILFGVVVDFSAPYSYKKTGYSLKVEEF